MHNSLASRRQLVLALLEAAAHVERALDRSLSGTRGVSFSEYRILAALAVDGDGGGGPATRVDLARVVGLTPSGVTRALKPLEKLGFVETRRDERDARRSRAALTPQGVELVADAAGVVDDVVASLRSVQQLPEAEREQILSFLQEVTRG